MGGMMHGRWGPWMSISVKQPPFHTWATQGKHCQLPKYFQTVSQAIRGKLLRLWFSVWMHEMLTQGTHRRSYSKEVYHRNPHWPSSGISCKILKEKMPCGKGTHSMVYVYCIPDPGRPSCTVPSPRHHFTLHYEWQFNFPKFINKILTILRRIFLQIWPTEIAMLHRMFVNLII